MILIICILFIGISFLVVLNIRKYNKSSIYLKITILILWILLIFIAGLRGENVDRDIRNYKDLFFIYKDTWNITIEPSFVLLSHLVKSVFRSNFVFLVIIYSFIGVSIKIFAIKKMSDFWLLSLLIYLSNFFLLQEMTQIRFGIATGLVLISLKPLYERKWKNFLVIIILAILFHYTTVVALLLLLLNPRKINVKVYAFLIVISYFVIYFLSFNTTNLINNIPIVNIQNKILAYEYDNNAPLNLFNIWLIMRIFLSFIFLWKIDLLMSKNKYSILLVKMFVFSICSYVLFSANPSYSIRVSDMFMVSDIILIPCIIYIIRPKYFARIIVIFISFSYLFLNLFYNKIFS